MECILFEGKNHNENLINGNNVGTEPLTLVAIRSGRHTTKEEDGGDQGTLVEISCFISDLPSLIRR